MTLESSAPRSGTLTHCSPPARCDTRDAHLARARPIQSEGSSFRKAMGLVACCSDGAGGALGGRREVKPGIVGGAALVIP